jgi:hypothetical protein
MSSLLEAHHLMSFRVTRLTVTFAQRSQQSLSEMTELRLIRLFQDQVFLVGK